MTSIRILIFGILLTTLACRTARRAPEAPAVAPQPVVAEPQAHAETPAAAAASHSAPAADHHPEVKGVDPKISLGWLQNGNKRFTKNRLRKDGQGSKDIERLSKGQHPHAIILSCSDSRVPPEIIFDQKLGEIFVIRTAGETLDDNVIGSIEYAVSHLGSRLILVMGHTSCGAIAAATDIKSGQDAGSSSLNNLLADIRPRLKENLSKDNNSIANAQGVAEQLKARSTIIQKAVADGHVVIQSALYHLPSGQVQFH